ncbi:hypothetical protein [Longimicrobium sp.]|uniref:hypothetical protein n=1 Tax=Longimicrobium sp. TaxID=2029185 RepID=UPI003B3A6D5D
MREPDVEGIRALIRECLAHEKLGRMADQVGMSPSGLRQFLGGSNAGLDTLRKVQAWFERRTRGDARSRQQVLLDELMETVPAAARESLRREFADRLSAAGAPSAASASAEVQDAASRPPIVYIDLRTSP